MTTARPSPTQMQTSRDAPFFWVYEAVLQTRKWKNSKCSSSNTGSAEGRCPSTLHNTDSFIRTLTEQRKAHKPTISSQLTSGPTGQQASQKSTDSGESQSSLNSGAASFGVTLQLHHGQPSVKYHKDKKAKCSSYKLLIPLEENWIWFKSLFKDRWLPCVLVWTQLIQEPIRVWCSGSLFSANTHSDTHTPTHTTTPTSRTPLTYTHSYVNSKRQAVPLWVSAAERKLLNNWQWWAARPQSETNLKRSAQDVNSTHINYHWLCACLHHSTDWQLDSTLATVSYGDFGFRLADVTMSNTCSHMCQVATQVTRWFSRAS